MMSQPSSGIGEKISPVPSGAKEQHTNKIQQIRLREVVLVAVLLFVGGLIGGYWYYAQQTETHAGGIPTFSKSATQVSPESHGIKPTTIPVAIPATTGTAVSEKSANTMHADVYFDFDRTRLRADAVSILQDKAAMLKQDANWVVLIQGYADQNGPAEYNKALASRRAGAVKQFLVELGVPQNSLKVATLGQAASICDDPSKECQQLNRRVHLEMIKRSSPAAGMDQARPVAATEKNARSSAGLAPAMHEDADPAGALDVSDQDTEESTNMAPDAMTPTH